MHIGVFENVAPHKNMLFDSENGDGPIDECIQGYLFFSDKPRVLKGLIKPWPLAIVVWMFKINIWWMVVRLGPTRT